jgi:glycosyltransferase involved in cell wall biosynthesis
MRILYDHQVFSLQDAGGASRYHYELVRSLAPRAEVQMEVWLGLNNSVYPFSHLASRRTHVVGWGGGLKRGRVRYIANEAFSNARAAFAGAVDVYHPTLYRSMPLVRAQRVVVTHHDCAHERFPELFDNAEQVIRAKRQLYACANAIICISESSRQDLLRFYDIEPQKTRVIHHGLTPLEGSPAAAAELRAQAAGEYLLFVGARGAYKNFDKLLCAFRSTGLHRSMQLLVLGGGAWTEQEETLIDELELANCVRVLPKVTDSFLAEAYAAANLLVYPSCCEGFGIPPLEAMAAGCPALVSNTSCLPEICHDAAFYFDLNDQASLERMLVEAISDQPARQRAQKRGFEVASLYSWQKCADETLALYRECQ